MAIKQKGKSLKARSNDLSSTFYQLEVLNDSDLLADQLPKFGNLVQEHGHGTLRPTSVDTFQINVGKMCNQTCSHCHVDAGPDRTEIMTKENLQICLDILASHDIPKIDLTGGAPEMHPHFRWFVEECSKLGRQVMDRCNLTIIRSNPKYHDLPRFLADHNVQVISSLPYFSKSRTDSQRGDGVFEDSIKALQMLNEVGYGQEGTGLILDLVYNPSGAFLPSGQEQLQAEFKRQLKRKFDITFNSLYAITNLPISRFLEYLIDAGNYADYMQSLVDAFNPNTVDGLMCRSTLSIGWDGYIYDCDFNQMLELRVASKSQHIANFDFDALYDRDIILNQHCYGCTAGAGSSCGGEIA